MQFVTRRGEARVESLLSICFLLKQQLPKNEKLFRVESKEKKINVHACKRFRNFTPFDEFYFKEITYMSQGCQSFQSVRIYRQLEVIVVR